jgi:hypothetical protein
MRRSRRIPWLLFVVAACAAEGTTSPPSSFEPEAFMARAPGPWVHVANGGGQDLYPGSTTTDFQISFNAREDAQGNDVGSVSWTDPTTGATIASGRVDCLHVTGNRAWVRYVADLGGTLFHVYIGFEDNGEGRKATGVDRHTFIYGGPVNPGNATCEDFANTNGFGTGFPVEWVRGNVQVR